MGEQRSSRHLGRGAARLVVAALVVGGFGARARGADAASGASDLRWDSPRVLHTRSAAYHSIDPCPPGSAIVELVVTFAGGGVGDAWPGKIASDGSWRIHEPLGVAGAPRGAATITAACFAAGGGNPLASYAAHTVELAP